MTLRARNLKIGLKQPIYEEKKSKVQLRAWIGAINKRTGNSRDIGEGALFPGVSKWMRKFIAQENLTVGQEMGLG